MLPCGQMHLPCRRQPADPLVGDRNQGGSVHPRTASTGACGGERFVLSHCIVRQCLQPNRVSGAIFWRLDRRLNPDQFNCRSVPDISNCF